MTHLLNRILPDKALLFSRCQGSASLPARLRNVVAGIVEVAASIDVLEVVWHRVREIAWLFGFRDARVVLMEFISDGVDRFVGTEVQH